MARQTRSCCARCWATRAPSRHWTRPLSPGLDKKRAKELLGVVRKARNGLYHSGCGLDLQQAAQAASDLVLMLTGNGLLSVGAFDLPTTALVAVQPAAVPLENIQGLRIAMPRANPRLIGRDAERQSIVDHLSNTHGQHAAISAPMGGGKSALAIEVSRRRRRGGRKKDDSDSRDDE